MSSHSHQFAAGLPATGARRRLVAVVERLVGVTMRVSLGLAATGVLIALCSICYAVVMRYAFNAAPAWVDDTVGFLIVAVVMLAGAPALRHGEHIGVDLLTDRLRGLPRRIAEGTGLVAALLMAGMLVVNGWETAMSSRDFGIMTSGQLDIPVFWLQLMLPLGGALMTLVAGEGLLRLVLGAPSLAVSHPQAALTDDAEG
ncbi:TRAP transporter small permease [Derxia gummosa]|uniref:TRAP transporter small permease protein n=1 Tax=Derxia gummosa DSM 723 TaxID=1121388 RepID=A0A8B6X8R4_9BURK|nr:TRAP transporter small permease [Derxia gummosa]